MLRILESQAPAKQTATDTINTLSNRLSSATLLEDRRAAILGLRSFAKIYPASVASGALRDLIAGLRRDGEDPDTLKIVLETLLGLFEPDEKSPEASEDITLWLADEFTQRQDNVTALLDLLETNEFFLRLYSTQILSHVCSARPQRAQEAIFTAPLGVSRITAMLDDRREAVRNEALLLLVALTPTSAELQKVVAFENAIDRTFTLIESEGGLTHGSTVVQDCLSLLSNLLRSNSSNQAYFRETGCIARVSRLLADVMKQEEAPDGVSEWIRGQRDMNLWGLLAIIQLFLVRGAQGTKVLQDAFWKNTVLQGVLQIAFHATFAANVRARALETCADVIRGNSRLQEQFGDLAVPTLRQSNVTTNGHTTPKPGVSKSGSNTPNVSELSNVIEQLLELTLDSTAATQPFEIRLAACNCVKAFFDGHDGIKSHVLKRAIEGHKSGEDAVPNILSVLLEPPNSRSNQDPYQQWMAAALLMHLLNENADGKAAALRVSETESEVGEDYELVTFIQSISSNIVAGVQHPEDERALLGYLMLLSMWLYEEPDAVNDLLGEASTIQGLTSAVKVATPTMPLVAGLCCFLLGVIYEFSTKDSPIPRAILHTVILKSLSREIYVDRLTKVRESAFMRDFEVLPIINEAGLPQVYFDQTFVDFFKDNFSRFLRAIDRDPGFEVSIMTNGVQKGVSRELVDTLRAQVEDHKAIADKAQSELVTLRQKLEQEAMEHRRTRESSSVELGRIRQINQSLQTGHEEELQALRQDLTRQNTTLITSHETTLAQLKRDHLAAVEQAVRQQKAEKDYMQTRQGGLEREVARNKEALAKAQAEMEKVDTQARRIQDEQQAEIEALHKTIRGFEEQMAKARAEHESVVRTLREELETSVAAVESRAKDFADRLSQTQTDLIESQDEAIGYETRLKEASEQGVALKTTIAEMQLQTQQATSQAEQLKSQLEASKKEVAAMQSQLTSVRKELEATKSNLISAREGTQKTQDSVKPESALDVTPKELEELRVAAAKQKDVQTELDDLLVVFADLETKRNADKRRLKELGEEVSDDEDDGDEEEEETEDQDEDENEDVD